MKVSEIKINDTLIFVELSTPVHVKKVTEKAIMINVNTSSWVHQGSKDIWIPKSCLTIVKVIDDKNITSNRTLYIYELPRWISKKLLKVN